MGRAMDIDEIRRANIRALESKHGPKLSKAAGMSPSQFYNLRDGAKDSKTGKPRGMRKETAWKIEDAAGVPRGWLDQDHGAEPGAPAATPTESADASLATLASAITKIPPTEREPIAKALYQLAMAPSSEEWRAVVLAALEPAPSMAQRILDAPATAESPRLPKTKARP